MESTAREFLERMLETPGPSGFEQPVQQVVREYAADFAGKIETDVHGNVILSVNEDARPRVMFAGHADQIGMLVRYIDDEGFLYFDTIGGWDPVQLVGQAVDVWTAKGAVHGVIGRKPIHLLTDEERKQTVTLNDLWIDIGAKDRVDAEKHAGVGDPVTLRLGMRTMVGDLVAGPSMDDKTGVWVVVEAFRRAVAGGVKCGLFSVATVQEEIGLRGARTSAYQIDPDVGIAVDVTHATDCPTIDKNRHGDLCLGGGPAVFRGPNMNPRVVERLTELAKAEEITYQPASSGRAQPNDSNVLQINRAGVATGLVAVPNRYMHSAVEMVSLADLDQAADLLAAFARSVSEEDDWTP